MQKHKHDVSMKKLQIIVLLLLVIPTVSFSDEERDSQERLRQLFLASEQLRMNDPSLRIQGIRMLFEMEGLYVYTTLQYLWLVEPHQDVRNEILHGFNKIGDHVYIADPDFPEFWMKGLEHYQEAEKQKRIKELKRFFSKPVKQYLKNWHK